MRHFLEVKRFFGSGFMIFSNYNDFLKELKNKNFKNKNLILKMNNGIVFFGATTIFCDTILKKSLAVDFSQKTFLLGNGIPARLGYNNQTKKIEIIDINDNFCIETIILYLLKENFKATSFFVGVDLKEETNLKKGVIGFKQ
jgi:hypothetical protein